MRRSYIGIDFGTTNVKAGLFDECGTELAMLQHATPVHSEENGSYYDPDEIMLLLQNMLRQLSDAEQQAQAGNTDGAEQQAQAGGIGGIVVTGMAEAGLMLRRSDGRALSALIPWYDRRTVSYSSKLNARQEEQLFYRTGLRNSFKYGIYKYLWCLETAGISPQNTIWLSAVDYIIYRLTGRYVTEPTYAARTYVYSLEQRSFDAGRLSEYGLTSENFPEVIPSGACAGDMMLQGRRIPVHIGAHDHVCAAYGMRLLARDAVCDSCGTAETYIGTMQQRLLTPGDYPQGYTFGPDPEENKYFWMANISSAGQSVEWYLKQLQLHSCEVGDVGTLLRRTKAPTGICYVPALSGMGTPFYNSELRAAFLGIGLETTGEEMLRAVIEGIACQGRMLLEPAAGEKHVVLCAGGASQCGEWMQIKADILGCELRCPGQKEATMTGAIALMLERQSGREQAHLFYRPQASCRIYQGREEEHLAYQEQYERYRKLLQLYVQMMSEQ